MSNQIIPVQASVDSVESFINTMAGIENQNNRSLASPIIVRLNGTTGKWVERSWNDATHVSEEKPFQDNTDGWFLATPLFTTYFAKWKYDEANTKVVHRTREFTRFDNEPVELLRISYGEKTATETIASFGSYNDFKAKYVKKDELTQKITSPYDFYVAVYAYHWDSKRVIKVAMKGSSRSAWFDFGNTAKADAGIKSFTQAKIRFSKAQEAMKDGKIYYRADFGVQSKNEGEDMVPIMVATKELDAWMRSWNAKDDTQEVKIEALPEKETEIRMEDIPF